MAKTNPLLQFGNVPVSAAMLESCFPELDAPNKKVRALEKKVLLEFILPGLLKMGLILRKREATILTISGNA